MDHLPSSRAPRAAALAALAVLLSAASLTACTGGGAPGAEPLALATVTPGSGPAAGGTPVTVEGAGFAAGARLRLGGSEATQVVVVSATRLTAVAPPHAAGPVDLEVLATDGRSAVASAVFTYVDAPVLSFVDPGHLPQSGGTVILHGAHFAVGAQQAAQAGARQFLVVDDGHAQAARHHAVSATADLAAAGAWRSGKLRRTRERPCGGKVASSVQASG